MEFTLERFRSAHESYYETALREIQSGRKESHWMWYIFPQIQGLGRSAVAQYYEIRDKAEAIAYWSDPMLSGHLVEICRELLKLNDPIRLIMGYPDVLKLRSCMTLFAAVSNEPVFEAVLDKFFDGKHDRYTQEKLLAEKE